MANSTKLKKKTRRRVRRVILTALGLLLLLGAVAVAVPTVYYRTRFLRDTRVAGVYCGDMTTEEAADALYSAMGQARMTLRDSGGETLATLPLSDLLSREDLGPKVAEVQAAQRREAGLFGWLFSGDRDPDARLLADVTAGDAAAVLERALYGDAPRVEPVDAYIEFGETGYTVVPETAGNAVDMDVCAGALTAALAELDDLRDVPDAVAEGGLLRPAVTTESDDITARTRVLDAYLDQPVAVDFGGDAVYTLTPEDIWTVSDFAMTDDSVDCVPDNARVHALVEGLIQDNGFDGLNAKFRTVAETREDLHYYEGDEGWYMDRQAVAEGVFDALRAGQGGTVTAAYDYTWFWKQAYAGYGVGDTFVEISIDNQYMWCYVDGRLLVETPVVTGNLSDPGSLTRRGCFRVTYKTTDTYLQGPTWYDHVDYWMPFDDQIGLHDSSWRDRYGGDIYLEDGSHGCINTPLEAMRLVYSNIPANGVVIVW